MVHQAEPLTVFMNGSYETQQNKIHSLLSIFFKLPAGIASLYNPVLLQGHHEKVPRSGCPQCTELIWSYWRKPRPDAFLNSGNHGTTIILIFNEEKISEYPFRKPDGYFQRIISIWYQGKMVHSFFLYLSLLHGALDLA
jgi:hypothetical protein